ncbi:hypothetical protein TNCV_750001 [Trichonephila clavipes]|nr:hypothetical protein TNCV_750001 [Trichonephila clavipes]
MEVSSSAFTPPTLLGRQDGEGAASGVSRLQWRPKLFEFTFTFGIMMEPKQGSVSAKSKMPESYCQGLKITMDKIQKTETDTRI